MRRKNGPPLKESLGRCALQIPKSSGGVEAIVATGWYLPRAGKVKVVITMRLASTHKGVGISHTDTIDWEGRKDKAKMREHVHALALRYKRLFRSLMWPEYGSYLKVCNGLGKDNFVQNTCQGCQASYCSIDR